MKELIIGLIISFAIMIIGILLLEYTSMIFIGLVTTLVGFLGLIFIPLYLDIKRK